MWRAASDKCAGWTRRGPPGACLDDIDQGGNSQADGDTYNRTVAHFDYASLFGKTVVGARMDQSPSRVGHLRKSWVGARKPGVPLTPHLSRGALVGAPVAP